MPDFFENFYEGKAIVHKVTRSFGELELDPTAIEVTEDIFDIVLSHGCMYQVVADENTASEDIKEYYAEERNTAMKRHVEEYNEAVEKYNEEHKDDEDFTPAEPKTFSPVAPEDMIYELDSSYVSLTEDGALNYIPFKHIFHKENRQKHDKLGVMLYEYVIDHGFNMEDAIEVILL